MFKSSNHHPFNTGFQDMQPRVSDQMNRDFTSPVSAKEIKEAIFSINHAKAAEPDGVFPKEWKYTHLCLIRKITEPKSISDIRPISFCYVIYKFISKILVDRLKPWMQGLISHTQSAFDSERLITDSITIPHELIHSLKIFQLVSS